VASIVSMIEVAPPGGVFAYLTDPLRFTNASGVSRAGTWRKTARCDPWEGVPATAFTPG
jgi:hypothetical protein